MYKLYYERDKKTDVLSANVHAANSVTSAAQRKILIRYYTWFLPCSCVEFSDRSDKYISYRYEVRDTMVNNDRVRLINRLKIMRVKHLH